MGQQAGHLAYHAHAYLLALPLFALNQRALAILAQDEVDATIGAAQARFFDTVALAPECLANQLFELTPATGSEAIQVGACVEEALTFAGAKVGE